MERLSSLPKAEMKVGEYVLEHFSEVLNCNVSELAELSNTSDASVVRFCKKMGYKGYQEFKISLAGDVIPPYKHFNQELDQDDSTETVCAKIFNTEVAALNETLSMVDYEAVEAVVKALEGARRVEIYGSGGSLVVGMDVQHKLLKIGIKASAVADADLQAMSASLLEKGDVALCISHSGSNRTILNCMIQAKMQGATTIALTAAGSSPLSKMADIPLFVATKQTVFKSESVSARIAQLALMDAVVAKISIDIYDEAYEAIQKTRKATASNKY